MSMTFSPEALARLTAVLEAETDNFVEVSNLAGLDPKTDYRFSNLSDVDFSDSDIRGFDFTGADLRGAKGTNVVWDETTILERADIDGSIFEVSP